MYVGNIRISMNIVDKWLPAISMVEVRIYILYINTPDMVVGCRKVFNVYRHKTLT